jgi:hypothetical protein
MVTNSIQPLTQLHTRLTATMCGSPHPLATCQGHLNDVLWGPRESAASGDAFLNFTYRSEARRTTGCMSRALVPIYTSGSGDTLAPEAGVQHLVQKYPYETRVLLCLRRGGGRTTEEQLAARLHANFSGQPCDGCRLVTYKGQREHTE